MFKKVLLATDGSEHALKAATYACHLMKLDPSIQTTIFHAYELPHQYVVGGPVPVYIDLQELNKELEEYSRQIIGATGEIFQKEGLAFDSKVVVGNPAQMIIETAQEEGFDLIIMGSRGYGEFKGLLMGSVSDRVLHHAQCPVLVIK